MKITQLFGWVEPVVDVLKALKNEFLIISGVILIVLTVWAVAAPQALEQFWGLFVFFGVLAFLAFLAALFAPALAKRLEPPIQTESSVTPLPETPKEPQEEPCPPTPTPEQQRACYLDSLIADCRRARLLGVDPSASDPTRGGMSLERLYISLDTQTRVEVEPDKTERTERRAFVGEGRESRPLPVLEALAQAPQGRMVLLGLPGAGKSTFVRYLTLRQAQVLADPTLDLQALLPGWSGDVLLPLIVPLGRMAESLPLTAKRGTADMIEAYLRRIFDADDALRGYGDVLLDELREHGGLVCFDGLDEVANLDLRPIVRQAVEDFADRYGRHAASRFLVTCRTYSYNDAKWQLTAWPRHELAPFDPERVRDFVAAWHRELARVDPARAAEYERKREELLCCLDSNDRRRLSEIAPNPLILTVMAVVHTHEGELPDARALVYEKCVDLFLNRWELVRSDAGETQKRSLLDALGVPKIALERVLQEIAYKAHEGGARLTARQGGDGQAALVTEDLLTGVLHTAFKNSEKVQIFLDYSEGANGLLMLQGIAPLPDAPRDAPEQRVYAFPHMTFEEYLAGRYLERLSNTAAKVREHVDRSDRWREPVMLLGEHLCFRSGDFERVDAMLEKLVLAAPLEKPTAEDWRAAWLAGDLLMLYRRALQGQPEIDKRVVERLAALVDAGALTAPERAAAGRTLAVLEDPRLGVRVVEVGRTSASATHLPDIAWQPIPAGPFVMGSEKKQERVLQHPETGAEISVPPDGDAWDDEEPAHIQALPYDYWMARYPITNAQFAAFERDPEGYTRRDWWTAAGWEWRKNRTAHSYYGGVFDLSNHPVVNVTWYEAVAFCNWLTEQIRKAANQPIGAWPPELLEKIRNTQYVIRLPTEAEWEKAARGALQISKSANQQIVNPNPTRRYPWGDTLELDVLTPEHANYDRTGLNATSAVGAFPLGVSPYGVLDLSGNVWEWCATPWLGYGDDYEKCGTIAAVDWEASTRRVVRGGSFGNARRSVRCACRRYGVPVYVNGPLGIRVVAAAAPSDSGL